MSTPERLWERAIVRGAEPDVPFARLRLRAGRVEFSAWTGLAEDEDLAAVGALAPDERLWAIVRTDLRADTDPPSPRSELLAALGAAGRAVRLGPPAELEIEIVYLRTAGVLVCRLPLRTPEEWRAAAALRAGFVGEALVAGGDPIRPPLAALRLPDGGELRADLRDPALLVMPARLDRVRLIGPLPPADSAERYGAIRADLAPRGGLLRRLGGLARGAREGEVVVREVVLERHWRLHLEIEGLAAVWDQPGIREEDLRASALAIGEQVALEREWAGGAPRGGVRLRFRDREILIADQPWRAPSFDPEPLL